MKFKKIILSIAPLWGIDHPSLGICYLTSYLEHNGYEVYQSDFNIEIRGEYSVNRLYYKPI